MAITVRRWDDSVAWNRFVASQANAHFQQSWEWGELAPEFGVKPVRLAALQGDEMVGAMQISVTPLAGSGRTYLYVPRGPALADPGGGAMGPLLDAARSVGEENRAVGVRLEPNVPAGSQSWEDQLRSLGLRQAYPPSQPRSSWLLDINPSEDELLAGMKQKTRYNIRLAGRKGVEVSEGTTEDIDAFYRLYLSTADRDGFFIQDRTIYERMFCLFRRSGSFYMLMARFEGEPIAAVTVVRFGGTAYYLQGASGNAHRNLMATYLLQWEAIRLAKRWGCSVYDFRAIPDRLTPEQDMFGVYRFKEGFGGYPSTVMHTFSAPYQAIPYGLWLLAFRARFDLDNRLRRRRGLPIRQSA